MKLLKKYCKKMFFLSWKRHFTFCLLGNVARTLRCRELPLLWPEDRRRPPTASSRSCRRKQTEGKFTQLWKSQHSIQTQERRAGEDGSKLSDAGADCRDRTLMWWADRNFYWMSDGPNKSMWTEYKTDYKKRGPCAKNTNLKSLCNQAHCEWEKNLKHFIQH